MVREFVLLLKAPFFSLNWLFINVFTIPYLLIASLIIKMWQQQLIIMELYSNVMQNDRAEMLSINIPCLSSNSFANAVFNIITKCNRKQC